MESTTTRPRKSAWKYILTALLALIALTACAWSVVALSGQARQQFSPSPVDLARQANRLRWLELWGTLWPPLSVVLAALLVLFLAALAWTLLRWLAERAVATYPDARGLFPSKALRAWGWKRFGQLLLPVQSVVLHNENKAAGPTTIYTPGWDGVVRVEQVFAHDLPPEQLRVTQGAQLAQIAAAVASGPGSTPAMRQQVGQRLPAVNIYNDLDRPLLSPNLPPVNLIDDSHIARLLREQGELPATSRRADQGNESI